eukprot:comp19634_c0_seq1/m.23178 comp19634_c0_seq1/g.23178  ORF comp19634_c0_seq1/g.23178 comp19634_c0_seq1/m.23178 type:complete len:400 (-) comp19634_c0_seq1:385-1584(-)
MDAAALAMLAQSGAAPQQANCEIDGLVGLSLIEAAQKSDPKGLVPAPVVLCANFIKKHGLEVEGILRKSGNIRRSKELLTGISNCFLQPNAGGMAAAELLLENEAGEPQAAIHDVSNALMRYLRGMPEPLLTQRLAPVYAKAIADYNEAKSNTEDEAVHSTLLHQIQILMKLLPACNRATLVTVVDMCTAIVEKSDTNLMTATNVGVCIGCTVAQPETLTFIIDHRDAILNSALRQVNVAVLEKAMASLGMGAGGSTSAPSSPATNRRESLIAEQGHRRASRVQTMTAAQIALFKRNRDASPLADTQGSPSSCETETSASADEADPSKMKKRGRERSRTISQAILPIPPPPSDSGDEGKGETENSKKEAKLLSWAKHSMSKAAEGSLVPGFLRRQSVAQ